MEEYNTNNIVVNNDDDYEENEANPHIIKAERRAKKAVKKLSIAIIELTRAIEDLEEENDLIKVKQLRAAQELWVSSSDTIVRGLHLN